MPDLLPEEQAAVDWVRGIGLTVHYGRPAGEVAFVPDSYVWIKDGELYIHPDRFRAGDFLHEAGHLAILPSFARPHASGDVIWSTRSVIRDYLASNPDGFTSYPEDPVARACIQCDDAEAIAWAWAAALACEIPPTLTTLYGFPNEDERVDVETGLELSAYLGIHGLRAAGFLNNAHNWPRLDRWLAP